MFLENGPKGLDLLVFSLDGHRYALPAVDVEQVIRAVTITPLPGAPSVIEGVIDVRGRFVPVLDLRRRFGLRSRCVAPEDLLILTRFGDSTIALRGDNEASVRRVEPGDIETSGQALSDSPFVAGLARSPDGTVVITDGAAFLSESESAALQHALDAKTAPAGR